MDGFMISRQATCFPDYQSSDRFLNKSICLLLLGVTHIAHSLAFFGLSSTEKQDGPHNSGLDFVEIRFQCFH